VKLHEQTKTLTFNQIAIESIRKLVLTILKNESKGLKDFFEANVPLEKGLYPVHLLVIPMYICTSQSLFSHSYVVNE
jgi:hypothetical protein